MAKPIPALTGVRFIAAFFVILAHGTYAVARFEGDPRIFVELRNFSALGMTIFFVLSGFVIHYTYSRSLFQEGGLRNFFVARLARLYPLYILLFVMELSLDTYRGRLSADLTTLPFYLSLTQSWWYGIYNDASLIYQYGVAAQVAWSISTETWFYLVYPAILWIACRLTTRTHIFVGLMITIAAAFVVVASIAFGHETISKFATGAFGEIAGGSAAGRSQDSFFRWLLYFAPYTRIFEFMMGCIFAQLYLLRAERASEENSSIVGPWLTMLAILLIAATHVVIFMPDYLPFRVRREFYFFHMNFGFAPACGLLIYCLAAYRTQIARFVSSRPIVLLGEASYSIYLLHMLFFASSWKKVVAPTGTNILKREALFLAVTLGICAASLVTYRLIEVPARRYIRDRLAFSRRRVETTPSS